MFTLEFTFAEWISQSTAFNYWRHANLACGNFFTLVVSDLFCGNCKYWERSFWKNKRKTFYSLCQIFRISQMFSSRCDSLCSRSEKKTFLTDPFFNFHNLHNHSMGHEFEQISSMIHLLLITFTTFLRRYFISCWTTFPAIETQWIIFSFFSFDFSIQAVTTESKRSAAQHTRSRESTRSAAPRRNFKLYDPLLVGLAIGGGKFIVDSIDSLLSRLLNELWKM